MRILVAPLLLTFALPATAQTVRGNATALDGDTIDMTGERIRLSGIDAPEAAQTCVRDGVGWECGADAKRHLRSLLQGVEAQCQVQARGPQGVAIGECMAGGRDLSEAMVAAGLAIAVETSRGDAPYADLEKRVRLVGSGLWGGTFDQPEAWRKAHPQARLAASAAPQAQPSTRSSRTSRARVYRNAMGCAIKGNASRRMGELIYYLPGMKYYEGTRPERLFCTEEEAQAAGFRLSRGG